MTEDTYTAPQKALHINLQAQRYGTFAEIGAGQEVARWFFHVGKASATIARSISAYDMAISDALYGATRSYVSRTRLEAMLDLEYKQLLSQLDEKRGAATSFFVFADTVATRGSSRGAGGHGWLGVRFQHEPRAEPSELIIHIEMLDAFASGQQETVGIAGVNLVYGAFTLASEPPALIQSLLDGLDRRRIEIDMIKFSGPAFGGVDNRLMSLQLVELGLTNAVMFTAEGEVVQPSEVLHNRPVMIERGSFRPVTNVTLAMLDAGVRQLPSLPDQPVADPLVLMEMTLNNLTSGRSGIDHEDFLARVDILGALHKTVMISSYSRFDSVTSYLRQYTKDCIGMVVGLPTLRAIFNEEYYKDLDGGILEGLGRLFRGPVKLFVYPTIGASGELETSAELAVSPNLQHLYLHLCSNGFIEAVKEFSTDQLRVSPDEVLAKLQAGDPSWADFVPPQAAEIIRRSDQFGHPPLATS